MTVLAIGPHLVTAVLRGTTPLWSWTPPALHPAFWAGGFTPPPFSPGQILYGATGFWADIETARA